MAFRVQPSGFSVQGVKARVSGSGFRVKGVRFKFRVWSLECRMRVSGVGFGDEGVYVRFCDREKLLE